MSIIPDLGDFSKIKNSLWRYSFKSHSSTVRTQPNLQRWVVGMNRYSCLIKKKALEQHMKRGKAHFSVFVQTMTKHWLEVLTGRMGRSPVRGADTPQQMSLAFYGIRSDPEMGGVRGSTEVSPSLLTLINESVLSLTLFFAYLYFSLLRFCKFALCFFSL